MNKRTAPYIAKHLTVSLLLTLISFVAISCNKDLSADATENEETPAILRLSPPESRGGAVTETSINTIRIMAFDGKNPSNPIKYNLTQAESDGSDPYKFEITTGKYHFVIITNEDSDPAMTNKLKGVKKLSDLDKISFGFEAFLGDRHFPMMGRYKNIIITVENEETQDAVVTGTALTIEKGVWKIEVERLAIKINTLLLKSETAPTTFKGIKISDLPISVPLSESGHYTGELSYAAHLAETSFKTVTLTGTEAGWWAMEMTTPIYLPSFSFDTTNPPVKLPKIEALIGRTPNPSATFGRDTDKTLPRGHYLNFIGTIKKTDASLETQIEIVGWEDDKHNIELIP